jgi:pimeloyl-ACP methyl ester carboxylesterase
MRTKLFAGLLVLALLLAGCGQATPTPTAVVQAPTAAPEPTATAQPEPPADTPAPTPTLEPAAEPVASFESAPCPMQLPSGQTEGETVECGYLVVPEDRANPEGDTIRLAIAIFHPPGGAAHPDPIVYLVGGPGGSALEFLFISFDAVFAPIFATERDLIVLDQRGIGYSEPALDCPAVAELGRELLDWEIDGKVLTDEESNELFLETVAACEEDLIAVADLTAYNTAANAADINDLRLALGYDQVNLWGTSYGTRLALGVMRDYPEGLRSVVLDSVYPPSVDLYMELPANAVRAFDTLFDGCAADAACNAAFPDLETVFFDTVDRLNETPGAYEVTDALTKERFDALLDGDTLVAMLFSFLYHTDVIPSLPQIIYDAAEGSFDLLALIQGSLMAQREAMSLGMQLSVQCNEELVFNSLEEYEALLADYPQLQGFLENALVGKPGFEVCEEWDSGQADPIENEPVVSDVPTLLLAGEFDPITPPAWARHAAETLPNGAVVEYAGVGHGASVVEGCPRDMLIAFFNDPTTALDDACVAEMGVQFSVPSGEVEAIELEPFTSEAMGITGLKPVGWTEANPGVLARGSSGLDVATLIEQAAPGSADDWLEVLAAQLGLDDLPESTGGREANGLTWTLYTVEVQSLSVDIALAESDGLVLIILLQSSIGERDGLYEAAFLPAIDNLVPIE